MKKLLILSLIVLIGAIIAYTLRESPHEFTEKECMKCHKNVDKDPSMLMAPVERLCGKCHKKGLSSSTHPINIKPETAKVPIDMPLKDGILTCNTCHNVHAKRYNAFGDKSFYLRRTSTGREFCISCHETNPLDAGHGELLDTAHMARKYRVTEDNQPLDGVSIECISCHDGTIGSDADYVIGAGYWRHLEGAHPIGVDYRKSRMKAGGLTPVLQLDKRIRFFGGKIGCGTCHDPYSKIPGKLVMGNVESRLCRECHFDK